MSEVGPHKSVIGEARKRLGPHSFVALVVWPAVSIGVGAAILMEQSISEGMPLGVLYLGMAAGALRMLPELSVSAGILLLTTLILGTLGASWSLSRSTRRTTLLAESVVLLLAGAAGLALEFPALLHHPLLRPLRSLSVFNATVVLFVAVLSLAAIIGFEQGGRRQALGLMIASVIMSLSWWGLAFIPNPLRDRIAADRTSVLFGIDSLSNEQDVALLKTFTKSRGGTWYERPVTPGFLTNTVWAAILMHRHVNETGVFFIRQAPDWSKAPFNLVQRARKEGYRTISFFSDQFTTFVGSDAGFDVDRSGPKGWLQVATTSVKDASVFLPILQSRLPELPFAGTPANQSGTYAFDVQREISDVLTAGQRFSGERVLVAAHLDYLHQSRYPRYSELDSRQRVRVRRAPVSAVHDLSFDWQYPEIESDPIQLYAWKLDNIQKLVMREVERSRFLDPSKNNKLILFSDHGSRRQLRSDNFGEPRFHRVVLATFGTPRSDVERPISLLDASWLLGFEDPTRPGAAEPLTVHVGVGGDEWSALMRTARLSYDGSYGFDERILRQVGQRMPVCRPYFPEPPYTSLPCRQ